MGSRRRGHEEEALKIYIFFRLESIAWSMKLLIMIIIFGSHYIRVLLLNFCSTLSLCFRYGTDEYLFYNFWWLVYSCSDTNTKILQSTRLNGQGVQVYIKSRTAQDVNKDNDALMSASCISQHIKISKILVASNDLFILNHRLVLRGFFWLPVNKRIVKP